MSELRPAGYFGSKVIDQFYPPVDSRKCFSLSWAKMEGLQFTPNALTIWTGFNGHGKSLFLNQVLLAATLGNENTMIASFEMPAHKTLFRLVRQATGERCPDAQVIFSCLQWLNNHVWIYDKMGTVRVKDMLVKIQQGIEKLGISQVVIDSLMKCGIDVDDLNAQKRLVDDLQNFAQQNACHIHLVAHARKDRDETQVPGKMDIKGAGEISDMADNVFSVWRNKPKEKKLAEGTLSDLSEFDAVLECSKCREDGEQEKRYGFYYHIPSMQYLESQYAEPIRYFLD